MRSEVIVVLVAVAGLVIIRRTAREWVRSRWLDDTTQDCQALGARPGAGQLLLT